MTDHYECHAVLALPRVQRHPLSDALADRAASLAARCKLRGADAVYVALAEALDQPLITLDQEILDRSARVIGISSIATNNKARIVMPALRGPASRSM
jgi:predicted nucleic acid-binding protein